MTHPDSPTRRITATALILLHLLVAGGVLVAHAQIDTRAAETHAESADRSSCPPQHDELGCEICRVLRVAHRAPESEPLHKWAPRSTAALPRADSPAAVLEALRAHGPRAPPLA